MPQGAVYTASLIQTVNDTRISNVFHFQQTTVDGPGDSKAALGGAIELAWMPVWLAALGAGWKALCVEIKEEGLTGQPFFRHLMSITGTRLGNMLNSATVATIATFTATGSHKGTGRTFISGLTDAQENRNNLSEAGLTELDTISNIIIAPLQPMVVGFQAGRYSDVPSPVFEPWILEDVRVPLTKLKSRRQSTKC